MKNGFELQMGGRLFTGILALCLAFMMLSVGYTQEAEKDGAATKEAKIFVIEPVVVSARKVEENVQDVPASISVFTDVEMEDAGIDTIEDITRLSSNVVMIQNGPEKFVQMRGISIIDGSLSGPTGFYVDDVPWTSPFLNDLSLFDVERVEILKGPQGTLYGKNSLSGVINVITKQPGNTFSGKVVTEYNYYDTDHGSSPGYRIGVNLSGPLVQDKLAFGIAGQVEQTDGYMENIYNQDDQADEEDRKSLRTTLRWTPSDALDISFVAGFMDGANKNGYCRYSNGPYATARHQIDWDGKYSWEEDSNSQTLRIKYKMDGYELLSVTGRIHDDTYFDSDYDFTSSAGYNYGNGLFWYGEDMLSQELRISSADNDSPFDWLIGMSGFTEKIDYLINIDAYGMVRDTDIERTGYALFGQGTYTLWGKLHLTAGLRYDYQELEGEQNYNYGTVQAIYQGESDEAEVLPKFSVAYDFHKNIMGYATVSKGYLEGGINYAFPTDNDSFLFLPEFAWNYEMGLKTMLWDDRLQFNACLFYVDMRDKQVIQWLTPLTRTIGNAADAHSQGLELEFKMNLSHGLALFAGYGYTNAEFDDYMAQLSDGSTADYEGHYLAGVPRHTYNIGAQYNHKSGFFSRIDLLVADEFYTDVANTFQGGDYSLLNLRLGYQGEKFDVILWGENILDDEYDVRLWDLGTMVSKEDGPPRRIGITVTWRF